MNREPLISHVAWMCLAGALSSVSAAELVVRDMQADITALPASFTYTVTSPTVSASGSDRFMSGTGLLFGGRRSFARPGDAIGMVAGVDLVSNTWTYSGGGWMWGLGGRLSAGMGWALTDKWTIFLEPGFGVGLDRLSLPVTRAGPGLNASGRWVGWDVRCSAGWQASEGLVIRGIIGWMSETFTHKEVDGISSSITPQGLMIGVGLSWRLSNAPEILR